MYVFFFFLVSLILINIDNLAGESSTFWLVRFELQCSQAPTRCPQAPTRPSGSFLSVLFKKSTNTDKWSDSLFFYMAGRILCTCGCGEVVSYTTKKNHLNARGKTSLHARVVTETNSLKRNTQQQQKPTPLLQRGLKKRASSNTDQDGSSKRHKAAQLEENQLPEITAGSQMDTDLMEDFLPPVAAGTDQQSMFMERSQGMMEMWWMASR
jgi:hypothetical protein